jgi:hypothetical protein
MPTFNFSRGSFTPSTTNDNLTVEANVAGTFGRIVAFGFGGRLTTSTGYRTRWVRPTAAGAGAGTLITHGAHNPAYNTPTLRCVSTYATTQPALPADGTGELWAQDWNAHGSIAYVALPLSNPWWIVNGALANSISCRNVAGVDANGSSYDVTVMED